MEPSVPLTRERRKRAHSTRCPCCCDDRGKPEQQSRRSRREDVDLASSSTAGRHDRSTSPKTLLAVKTNSKLIKAENPSSLEIDDGEENSIKERRVLRSGQSTPIPSEIEKEKMACQSKKVNSKKAVKKNVLATQKGKAKMIGNKNAEEKPGKTSLVQDSNNFKPILKKSDFTDRKNKQVDSPKSKIRKIRNTKSKKAENESTMSSQVNQRSDQVENIPEVHMEAIKKTLKRKRVKLPPVHRQSLVKKTLATDKLKIKAFNNLKEKLEIAFQKSPLTVPACVEFFEKITAANLQDILERKMPARASQEILSGDNLTEVTESGSEARMMEKALEENMNESEAAKALVSFKVQTTDVSSTSSQSSTSSNSQELQTYSKELTNNMSSHESAYGNPFNNLDHLTAAGLTSLPLNLSLQMSEVKGSAPSMALPNSAVSNIPMVQTPMAFQLLQVPSPTTKANHPRDVQATPFQQTPGFIYQNPTAIMNKLTSVNQQATNLFPPTFNQLLYLTNLKQQCEGKPLLNPNLCGFLPAGMQDQGMIFSSTSSPNLSPGLVNTTVQTLCPQPANIAEIQPSTKLRPILPREPSVASSFSPFASQGLKPSTSCSTLANNAIQSCTIKQEIKRLVSERSKTNDPLTTEVTKTLPDINSTFVKNAIRPSSEASQSELPLGLKCSIKQETTEMTSKEQAIKALLSIGGNGSSPQHGNRQPDSFGNRIYEANETNDLQVVFDTDKGIFKVDDVTIDPLVNTIGKESYTCGKCRKIFTSLSYLARHIKRVCPDMSHRKWKCNHCDKAFRHPFGLQQHIYTHTGERPHKCPQCPKAFYSSNDLRRHSRIHSGERPYKCKHCGKSFATTISLKTHTFIHTGEKPHRCPHCTKTFATSSKLGRHIVTHSEQRPFSCHHCPKTFNRSGDLRRHILHVHNGKLAENPTSVVTANQLKEKIYRCTECIEAFYTPKELEAHINVHTTESMQKCV